MFEPFLRIGTVLDDFAPTPNEGVEFALVSGTDCAGAHENCSASSSTRVAKMRTKVQVTGRLPLGSVKSRIRLAALGVILFSGLAQAETPEASVGTSGNVARDPAAAEALFRAGRQLIQEGKLEEAYAKFEESYRLDPTAGALLNQGECRLREGKTASAWALYQQSATLADVQGKPDLFDLASQRQRELEPNLSYVTFHVAKAVPGLEVKRDGVLVGAAQFDVTLPVDPGRHFISAQAPGYESVQLAVVVHEKHDRQIVNVPALKERPIVHASSIAPQPKPQPTVLPEPVAVRPEPWPWLLGGVGATSLLVGTVSGLLAIHENDYAKNHCKARLNCNNEVLQAQGRRDTEANVAWVTIPIGIVALGSAATWLLAKPRSNTSNGESPRPLAFGTFTNGRDATCWVSGAF